ncbi:MAG: MJ1477/TM1410 family putative glycoside hydrolase [Aliarcobacter sp.]
MKNLHLSVAVLTFILAHFACAESNPASFAYILQADSFAQTKPAAIAQLKQSGRDWIVLDAAFAGDTPWEQADLDTIRSGKAGRKVVAYLSIGEAEDYRSYWQSDWVSNGKRTAAAPMWLGIENPEWKGNYQVKYWNADWQKLVLAAVDDAMARGFDGVYLDIVDGFETYEQGADGYLDDRMNPETKQTYRRDMVDWVKAIAARARAKNSAALVIPQNGSQLVVDKDFVEVISAQGIEDLFTNGKKLQPASHTDEILGHLKILALAKKPVLLIEYPRTPERQALSKKLAKQNSLIWLVTDRQLKTLGESGK